MAAADSSRDWASKLRRCDTPPPETEAPKLLRLHRPMYPRSFTPKQVSKASLPTDVANVEVGCLRSIGSQLNLSHPKKTMPP